MTLLSLDVTGCIVTLDTADEAASPLGADWDGRAYLKTAVTQFAT